MITYKQGNIFDESVEALVNPVNCVGVMGKGLALEFKRRFPANFSQYKKACEFNLTPGGVLAHRTHQDAPKYILNFATKDHWRDSSDLCYITTGLTQLGITIDAYAIQSIAIPALGCGLDGFFNTARIIKWLSIPSNYGRGRIID